MMPPIVVILPLYMFFIKLRLLDTRLGLILAHTSFNLPFAIWMLIGFFRGIPTELDEAALIDGCGPLGALWRIVVPVARSGLLTTLVFCVLWSWNDYIFAFSLTRTEAATITVPISGFLGEYIWHWCKFYAGGTVAALPIIVLAILTQRYLVRGLTFGSIK